MSNAETSPAQSPAVLPARMFDLLVQVLGQRREDIAHYVATGASFESWIQWEWYAAAARIAEWKAKREPPYSRHSLVGPSPLARGDLFLADKAGQRVWIELGLVHDWTSAKWYYEEGKLHDDRQRLKLNVGKGIDLMQVIVVASKKQVASNERWMVPLRRSGCWDVAPDYGGTIPMWPAGEIMIAGWLIR